MKNKMKYGLFLLTIIFMALIMSNFTENILSIPSQKVMTLVTSGQSTIIRFDQHGIPQNYYNRLRKCYYNPVYISMYALKEFEKYSDTTKYDYFLQYYKFDKQKETNKDANKRNLITCANWLKDNLVMKNNNNLIFGVWEYHFPWEKYNLKSPWVSGMAQGCGIQVLLEAYKISGDISYLDSANLAMKSFLVTIEDGGVTIKDSHEQWWYEEYSSPESIQSRVLNGMEHSLIALNDYYVVTGDSTAKELFNKGVLCLEKNIYLYDSGWWKYYDAVGTLANNKYHPINVKLTKQLYEITNNNVFYEISKLWSTYNTPFIGREFIYQRPNYIDMLVLGFNLLFCLICVLVILFLKNIFKRGI